MPNIVQYTNPIDHITPSEVGSQAFEQSGMRIAETYARAGNAIGDSLNTLGDAANHIQAAIAKHQNQTLVSQYTAASTSLFSNLNDQWNKIVQTTNPNLIPQAQKDFLANVVKPQMEKLIPADGIFSDEAHNFAQDHVNDMLTHFQTKTTADVALASSQALIINLNQSKDSLAHAVNQDPSSIDYALTTFGKTANSLIANAHGLTAEQSITARSEVTKDAMGQIAFSGIAGAINKNPAAGMAMLNSGKYSQYLSTTQAQQLDDYGRTIVRFNETQARISQALGAVQAAAYSKQEYSNAVGQMVGDDGSLKPLSPQQFTSYMHDPNIPGDQKRSLLSLNESLLSGKVGQSGGDPHVSAALLDGITREPGTPGALTTHDLANALAQGKISSTTFLLDKKIIDSVASDPTLRMNMKDFSTAMPAFRSYIIAAAGATNTAQGLIAANAYQEAAQQAYQDGLQKGLKPADMLDPGGKDYLGSSKMLLPYMNMATQAGSAGVNGVQLPPQADGSGSDDGTAASIAALGAASQAAGAVQAPVLGDGDAGQAGQDQQDLNSGATEGTGSMDDASGYSQ